MTDKTISTIKDKEFALQQSNDHLNQIIGAKDETISGLNANLIRQREDFKEKEMKVRVETITLTPGMWGGTIDNVTTTYKNLDDVKSEMEIKLSKDLKLNKVKLEDEILDLEIKLESKDRKHDRSIKRMKAEAKVDNQDLRDSQAASIKGFRKTINNLNGELIKERENKTDAELEAKRKLEIVDLRKQIANLKRKVNNMSSMSLWDRVFNTFKLNEADIEAAKTIAEDNVREQEIVNNNTNKFKLLTGHLYTTNMFNNRR